VLKGLIRTMLLMPALAVLIPFAAHAADAGSCDTYAKAAVEQVNTARSNSACKAGVQGARWSGAFRVHFVYCMSHTEGEVQNLRSARADFLRSCGATQ
jgi:hypothetical protein